MMNDEYGAGWFAIDSGLYDGSSNWLHFENRLN